jgi:branched-chain amino acid transport system substrate-binding protein
MNNFLARRILILAANPKDTTRVRLDEEVREIQEGLQRSRYRDQFVVVSKWAVRPRDIHREILDLKPHIIHFCGHGSAEEGLAFEDSYGQAQLVNGEALAELFKLLNQVVEIECVVLNACYSEVQAEAISRHIQHVIGMSRAIGDRAAIEFSVGFYDALGAGESVDFAFRLGRNLIRIAGISEHLTPILYPKKIGEIAPTITFSQADKYLSQDSEIQPERMTPDQEAKILDRNEPPPKISEAFRERTGHNTENTGKHPYWGCLPIIVILILGYAFLRSCSNEHIEVQKLMSFGERSLVLDEAGKSNCPADRRDEFENHKKKAADFVRDAIKNPATASANYSNASSELNTAFTQNCNNAPEALIYLNNALIGTKQSYTIAVPVPITENDSEGSSGGALMMLRGFAHAQKEINDNGGIKGVPLRLMIVDDKGKPDVASQVAVDLAEHKPDVLAVMGHWSSNVSIPAAEQYSGHKLTFITPISINEKLDESAYAFRVNATSQKGAEALAGYMHDRLRRSKALIIYEDDSLYSKELKEKFAHALGKQGVVGEINLSSDTSNSSRAQFEAIKGKMTPEQKRETVLVLFPGPRTVDAALSIVKDNNNNFPMLGDMANLYDIRTLESGKYAKGMVLAPSWNIDADTTSDFACKSRDLWGRRDVSWSAAMSYNAAKALIQALADITGNPTRSGIKEALFGKTFAGVSGNFRFSKLGQADTGVQLVQVNTVNQPSGNAEWKFVPFNKGSGQCEQKSYWTFPPQSNSR